ncbi:MAG: Ig-like domain-containing protein [Bacilli bacterium]
MVIRKKAGKLFLSSFMLCGALIMSSCGPTTSGTTTTSKPTTPTVTTTEEKIAVKEISLELSKTNAKVGETVTAIVTIRPTNATNKTFALSSSDETIAKIEGSSIICLKAGTVTITARSKDNTTKKAEVKLVVLGTDSEGRTDNIFEAEEGNIIKGSESNPISIETTNDERVSGTGVVGKLTKGDRIIWGINSSAADTNALLKLRLMGPSGWVGMWDSIPYNFADWYTFKLNGKVISTENIEVTGTSTAAGSADYYAVKDVEIGKIELTEGLNVITFALSNRFDQITINMPPYNGTLNCWGNIDALKVISSKDLTYVPNTVEVANPEPDINFKDLKMEVEDANTRIYKDASNPKVDLGANQFVEFAPDMNVMFGVKSDIGMKTKLKIKVAAPYVDATTLMNDVALNSLITMNIDGKEVDLSGMKVLGNNATGTKENYTEILTPWLDLKAGENVISIVVNSNIKGFSYLGGLDCMSAIYIKGTLETFLNAEPAVKTATRLEAEAATTKRVGYADLASGATSVELIDAKKVQTDKYKNKLETTKIIYGIESSIKAFATIKLKMASPFINSTTVMEDVSVGSLGDLWVNGTMISTPNLLLGNNKTNDKSNFTEITIATQVELEAGKNRIAWEPQNYTKNSYEFFGAMDYIEVITTSTITPYEVNFWADRNTYFDNQSGNDPILVTCDKVSSTSPDTSWIALYEKADPIQTNAPGSLYWYYPTNASYNTDQTAYLGTPCDITKQSPNGERPLISKGGFYKIVYMEKDSRNSTNGYDAIDTIYISAWNDPAAGYGGCVEAK